MNKDILLKSDKIHLSGKLKTNTLTVDQVQLTENATSKEDILQNAYQSIERAAFQTKKIPKVRELVVNKINGIFWNDFYNSVYLKDANTKIEGNLLVLKSCHVKNLIATHINDIRIDSFMTMNTDQTIELNITMARFNTPDLKTNIINGIEFGQNVAVINEALAIECMNFEMNY